MLRLLAPAAVVATGLALLMGPAFGADSLPGGATSLTEVHGDWTVRCGVTNNVVQCAAQQEQLSSQTKQRVLAIELKTDNGAADGTLVLPFGLLLKNGAVLKVDDKMLSEPQPFQTCLPAGCLVPLTFGADWAKALRAGTTLTITAQPVSGPDAKFTVSLQGLGSALDRITDLMK